MPRKDQEPLCQQKPLLVDTEGNLSMDEEIAGEQTLDLMAWMAEQEERLAAGLSIETPPPLD